MKIEDFKDKDYWFQKYHYDTLTQDFIDWWIPNYEPPQSYEGTEIEQEEYYLRMGFALMGWLARK